jgi:hypothetical protein
MNLNLSMWLNNNSLRLCVFARNKIHTINQQRQKNKLAEKPIFRVQNLPCHLVTLV